MARLRSIVIGQDRSYPTHLVAFVALPLAAGLVLASFITVRVAAIAGWIGLLLAAIVFVLGRRADRAPAAPARVDAVWVDTDGMVPESARVFEAIVRGALTLLGVAGAELWLRDAATDGVTRAATATVSAVSGLGRPLTLLPPQLVGALVAEGRTRVVPRLADDPLVAGGAPDLGSRFTSMLAAPLAWRDHRLGALVLLTLEERRFSPDEQHLFEAFAATAASAIEAVRSGAPAGPEATTDALDAGSELTTAPGVAEMGRWAAREIARVVEADFAGTWFLTPSGDRFVGVAGYHVPSQLLETVARLPVLVDDPFVRQLRASREPIFSREPVSDHPLLGLVPHRSFLVLPMWSKDALVGALVLAWLAARDRPPADTLRLAEGIARHAAVAMQNVRLLEAEHEARERLAVSEASYRELVENVSDVVYVHDLDYRITAVNEAAVHGSGYSREELLGRSIAEFVSPPDFTRYQALVERMLAGEPLDVFTAKFFRKDGGRAKLELRGRVVFRDGAPIGVQGVARDVTVRQSLEKRQRTYMELVKELAGQHSFERIVSLVGERVCELLGVDTALFCLIEGDEIVLRGWHGIENAEIFTQRRRVSESRIGRVILTQQPFASADMAADPHWRDSRLVTALGYRAALDVPILLHDRPIGVLGALHHSPRGFADEDVELLVSLAGHLAIALDRTRLVTELNARLQETQSLLAVSEEVSSTLDRTETIRRVARQTALLLGADMVGAYAADPDRAFLRPMAGYRVPRHLLDPFMQHPIPLRGHRFVEEAWNGRRPVFTSDMQADRRLDPDTIARFPCQSGLFFPMLVKGEPIGGLWAIWWTERREFTRKELRLVEGISRQAAIFVENARLYEEAMRRRREAEEMARLARTLTETLEVADVGQRIVESARALLGGIFSTLRIVGPDGALRLIASAAVSGTIAPPPLLASTTGIAGRAVASGAPAWSPDVLNDPTLEMPDGLREQMRGSGAAAFLAVPLRLKRTTIGVLGLGDRSGRVFTDSEIALLQAFADQAAIALDNSRLYDELRGALHRLEESQQRVMQTERLQALGEMAGGVAHDFNNALSTIVGRAEVLLGDTDNPEVRRQLDAIVKVVLDAARTVRRIQEFTRKRRERPFEPVDLGRVAEEVRESLRPRWEGEAERRGVRYEVAIEADAAPAVHGDAAELREALTNVVSNALDAMPDGGPVKIRITTESGRVACAVSDRGVGMTEGVRRRVFDPFFTTKGEAGGGLGLSVVYGIVARHGGEIDVDTRPGEGACFTIRLPFRAPVQPEPVPPASPAPAGASARVLVVDDEADVRDVLTKFLSRDGHRVEVAADGETAITCFERDPFDIVITDLGMPRVSGWEVARRVKLRSPGTAVIMITGWGDRLDLAEARQMGVDHVVAKPFKREEIRRLVGEALASRADPA